MTYHTFSISTAQDPIQQWNDAIDAYRKRWGKLPGVVACREGTAVPERRITVRHDNKLPADYWYFEF